MKKIGVTGGIGSGKSLVCKIFSLLGIPVFNADDEAKKLMNFNPDVKEKIANLFGASAYDNKGLNRKWMAGYVFNDPEKLNQLNTIVHPATVKAFDQWVDKQNSAYVIKEAAILFETGLNKQLDKIILVDAPENLRIKRITNRDQRTEENIRNIISHQWPSEKTRPLADFIIDNDDQHPVIQAVLDIHDELISHT